MTTILDMGIGPIDWNAKGEAAVLQRVRNLLGTRQYEIAYDRGRGVDADLVDQPADRVLGQMANDVAELLTIYEPQAEMVSMASRPGGGFLVTVKVVSA